LSELPNHAERVAWIKDAIGLLSETVKGTHSDCPDCRILAAWGPCPRCKRDSDHARRYERLAQLYHEHGSALAGPRSDGGHDEAG